MVFALMAISSVYDIYVTRKYSRRNVIYDLEKHAKLEQLAGRNQKPLSGKARYLLCPSSCVLPSLLSYAFALSFSLSVSYAVQQ